MSDSLPHDEVLEKRRTVFSHWLVLGLLVAIQASMAAIFILFIEDFVFWGIQPIVISFVLFQAMFFAFWAAFAPWRFSHRFLWSLLLCAVVFFLLELGTLFAFNYRVPFIMPLGLALFLTATPVLLLVRRWSRWQLIHPGVEIDYSAYRAHQFGIKHLLILTTIVALIGSLFRTLLVFPMLSSPSVGDLAKIAFQGFGLFTPLLLVLWLLLAHHKRLCLSLFWVILLFGLIDVVTSFSLSEIPFSERIWYMLLMQLGAGVSALISGLVLRWCGFRMARVKKGIGLELE